MSNIQVRRLVYKRLLLNSSARAESMPLRGRLAEKSDMRRVVAPAHKQHCKYACNNCRNINCSLASQAAAFNNCVFYNQHYKHAYKEGKHIQKRYIIADNAGIGVEKHNNRKHTAENARNSRRNIIPRFVFYNIIWQCKVKMKR